ncbi:hypothetical protein L9F63_028071, partial [Diploptera punctata]
PTSPVATTRCPVLVRTVWFCHLREFTTQKDTGRAHCLLRHTTRLPGGACPGPNCSPEAAALLKASRDGDETALKHLLHKAEKNGGLREEDLNCQDSSGRVSFIYFVL